MLQCCTCWFLMDVAWFFFFLLIITNDTTNATLQHNCTLIYWNSLPALHFLSTHSRSFTIGKKHTYVNWKKNMKFHTNCDKKLLTKNRRADIALTKHFDFISYVTSLNFRFNTLSCRRFVTRNLPLHQNWKKFSPNAFIYCSEHHVIKFEIFLMTSHN
jgi:hypothetical protein